MDVKFFKEIKARLGKIANLRKRFIDSVPQNKKERWNLDLSLWLAMKIIIAQNEIILLFLVEFQKLSRAAKRDNARSETEKRPSPEEQRAWADSLMSHL